MVPTLPPEIWMTTAEFIPSSTLRNLYSVNSVFLQLALNERYSDVNLFILWDESTSKYLMHLNHPHIAHRVRKLTLVSNWVESAMDLELSKEITMRTTLAWYLPFHLGRFIDPVLWRIFDVKTLVENIVPNFPNLSSLTIFEGSGSASLTRPDPLLVNSYAACASKLRTLTLMASSDLNTIFPPNASELTSLEEVKLYYTSTAETEAASTFFQAIASTLTTLNISYRDDTSDEAFRLLQSFPCQKGNTAFPKLTNFSLTQLIPPAFPNAESNLMQFLNQHADTLKHLHLQYRMPPAIASKPPLLPVLPHLETLTIINDSSSSSSDRKHDSSASREGLDTARAYVQHSSTLTSLGLTHCSFTLRDLGMLLGLLRRRSSGNTMEGGELRSLTVNVQVLSPQLLDMLAEKVPRLTRLKVDFVDLRSMDVPIEDVRSGLEDLTQEDIESFLLEMKKRRYSNWALRSFGIGSVCVNGRPDKAMAILMPLGLCVPHLVEIDGGHVEMWRLREGNSWKPSDSEVTRRMLAAYPCINRHIDPQQGF